MSIYVYFAIIFCLGTLFGMLIMGLFIANNRHDADDILAADNVFVDNMAIVLKDTSSGREAFKQLTTGELMYLSLFINSPAVKNKLDEEKRR